MVYQALRHTRFVLTRFDDYCFLFCSFVVLNEIKAPMVLLNNNHDLLEG